VIEGRFGRLRDVLTVAETAEVLRLGRSSVYKSIQRGEIPAIRIGRRILVVKTRLMQFLEMEEAAERERQIRAAQEAERDAAMWAKLERQAREYERMKILR
jgi:excisionase family DNA binding protein